MSCDLHVCPPSEPRVTERDRVAGHHACRPVPDKSLRAGRLSPSSAARPPVPPRMGRPACGIGRARRPRPCPGRRFARRRGRRVRALAARCAPVAPPLGGNPTRRPQEISSRGHREAPSRRADLPQRRPEPGGVADRRPDRGVATPGNVRTRPTEGSPQLREVAHPGSAPASGRRRRRGLSRRAVARLGRRYVRQQASRMRHPGRHLPGGAIVSFEPGPALAGVTGVGASIPRTSDGPGAGTELDDVHEHGR